MDSTRTYAEELHSSDKIVSPGIEETDITLVARVQAGDVQVFDQLIRKYRARLYSVIYNLTSNREDAADLTQETLIKAFQNIHRFGNRSSFFTWLYRIGINHTLTYLRKNRLKRFFSFDSIQEDLAPADVMEKLTSRSKTERSTLIRELQEQLNEALQKLSPKHRTVVVLHEIDQLSLVEIAKIINCPEATVRSRLHYARKQLQAELAPYLSSSS